MPRLGDPRFARYRADLTEKWCPRCGDWKAVDDFRWKRHWRGDHRYHVCRSCDAADRKQHREAAARRVAVPLATETPRRRARGEVVLPDCWRSRNPLQLNTTQYAALNDWEIEAHPVREVRAMLRARRRAARLVRGLAQRAGDEAADLVPPAERAQEEMQIGDRAIFGGALVASLDDPAFSRAMEQTARSAGARLRDAAAGREARQPRAHFSDAEAVDAAGQPLHLAADGSPVPVRTATVRQLRERARALFPPDLFLDHDLSFHSRPMGHSVADVNAVVVLSDEALEAVRRLRHCVVLTHVVIEGGARRLPAGEGYQPRVGDRVTFYTGHVWYAAHVGLAVGVVIDVRDRDAPPGTRAMPLVRMLDRV